MGQSGMMNFLMTDEELLAMRKEWKEQGIKEAFPPYNYDEYGGMDDYKGKIRKSLDAHIENSRDA